MLSGLVSILVMIGAIFIVGWIAVTLQLQTQKGLDQLSSRVQSRGGQLLICLPDRPWRLARLNPGNASRLLQALAALPPK